MDELNKLRAELVFETEVLEDCKQAVKSDPSLVNKECLRDAREHLRTLKSTIEIVRGELVALH